MASTNSGRRNGSSLRERGTKRSAKGRRQRLFDCLAMGAVICAFAAGPAGTARESEWAANPEIPLWVDAHSEGTGQASSQPIARVVQRLPLPTGGTAVAWSPDGKVLATMGGLRQRITLWDPKTGERLWEAAGDLGGGDALAFSNNGRLLLTSTARAGPEDQHTALTLWDVATGTIAGRVAGPFPNEGVVSNFARYLALDRQHGLLAIIAQVGPGRPVAIYDTQDWSLRGTIVVNRETPTAVAFGSDGTVAVGTVRGHIAIFDARTQSLKRIIDARAAMVSIAYSPDGKSIAANPLRIWSTADGVLVRDHAGISDVQGLAWSPDGRYLAIASFDHTVRLWPIASADPGQVVATFNAGAWAVAFSPDSRFLAAAGSGGAVIMQITN